MLLEKPVFKMYTKSDCPFCDKARKLILEDLKTSLHLVDVSNQQDLRDMIISETGIKTVPVIYLGDELVGGCDDLIDLIETSSIEKKILTVENQILRDEVMRLRRSV